MLRFPFTECQADYSFQARNAGNRMYFAALTEVPKETTLSADSTSVTLTRYVSGAYPPPVRLSGLRPNVKGTGVYS
jgi:hypothetical protein